MSKSITKNEITEGVLWKQLLIFFLPIAVGSMFQQLYNTVDAIIVGRFVGKEALASVGGSASVVTFQVITFFTYLSSGATVLISQYFGAKDSKKLHESLHTAYAFTVIASIFITVLGFCITPWFLTVTKTPTDILPDSILYLRIYFIGIISTFVYNMGSSIMRAIGDSKRPLHFLILCSFLNIGLDLVFVVLFKMGIAGAAIATVLSQTISAILVTKALMTSYGDFHLILKEIHIDRNMLLSELRIGIPGSLQACMYGFTNIIIQTSINSFGTDTAAAWAAFGKIDMIFWAVNGALGLAATTFAGQNYGAGYIKRVRKSVSTCILLSLCICGTILGSLMIFASPLFHLFTNDAQVISIGVYMLVHILPSYFIFIFVEIISGGLRGIGNVMIPTIITLTGVCGVRLPWILIMVPIRQDISTILISYPLAWGATALFLIPYYFYAMKRLQ